MKKLNNPFEKNFRAEAPLGRMGVPPDAAIPGGETYIIVTDKKTAERVIEMLFPIDENLIAQ